MLAASAPRKLALPKDLTPTGAVVLLLALAGISFEHQGEQQKQGDVVRFAPGGHPLVRLAVHDSAKPGRSGPSRAAVAVA